MSKREALRLYHLIQVALDSDALLGFYSRSAKIVRSTHHLCLNEVTSTAKTVPEALLSSPQHTAPSRCAWKGGSSGSSKGHRAVHGGAGRDGVRAPVPKLTEHSSVARQRRRQCSIITTNAMPYHIMLYGGMLVCH